MLVTILIIAVIAGIIYGVYEAQKQTKVTITETDDLAPESTPAPSVVAEIIAAAEEPKKKVTKKPTAKAPVKTKAKAKK